MPALAAPFRDGAHRGGRRAWAETVEHAGSTAVPGFDAKPVVEVLVGLKDMRDAQRCVRALVALGYSYWEEGVVEEGYDQTGFIASNMRHEERLTAPRNGEGRRSALMEQLCTRKTTRSRTR